MNMRYFPLLLSLLILACKQKQEGFLIQANIEGLNQGKVYLAKLNLETNERIYVDTTEIINGTFSFQGKVESPYLHSLFINSDSNKIHLFLENSLINISANYHDLEKAKVSGSREDSLFRSYELDDIFDRKKGMEIMLYYPEYSFSAFTAYYQFQLINIHADTLDHIMNNFSAPVKQTVYYHHLEQIYHTLKRVAISQPAPAFSIPNENGKLVHLKDFKGKYVLLDFWASWCAPCREANPLLAEAHKTFKDKNFTIISISVDDNKQRWLDAIRKDQLIWTNVSHLKGWDEITDLYGVKAVPQNFLLNPNGIIVDKNIEPEDLIAKLGEILLI